MPSATWPVSIDPNHLYFVTTRAVQRANIFRRALIKRILIDSLNTGRILGQYAPFAFVIMPNHIHLILQCLNDCTPGEIVREFKKAAANLIVRQYEAEGNAQVLEFPAAAVQPGRKEQYTVWEHEYRAKNVFSSDFLRQKIEYIHKNPIQPHWQLAERPEEYP